MCVLLVRVALLTQSITGTLRSFTPPVGYPPRSHLLVHPSYRPSYRHPAVTTCRLGKPGHILGSAATGTARSAVGGPFQTPEAASWRSVGCHRPPSVASTRPSAMSVRAHLRVYQQKPTSRGCPSARGLSRRAWQQQAAQRLSQGGFLLRSLWRPPPQLCVREPPVMRTRPSYAYGSP